MDNQINYTCFELKSVDGYRTLRIKKVTSLNILIKKI